MSVILPKQRRAGQTPTAGRLESIMARLDGELPSTSLLLRRGLGPPAGPQPHVRASIWRPTATDAGFSWVADPESVLRGDSDSWDRLAWPFPIVESPVENASELWLAELNGTAP